MSEPTTSDPIENPAVPKETTPGVLYVPRVPPYMHAHKMRHLLSAFGAIGRIYLTPEDETAREKRVKSGGQKKTLYLDGWVEFEDKRVARAVAEQLNGTLIGGKKQHNFYRDDLWTLRYLPKFQWQDLHEHLVSRRASRQQRLSQRLDRAAKEDEYFLKNARRAKAIQRKLDRGDAVDEKEWTFRQKTTKNDDVVISSSLVSNLTR